MSQSITRVPPAMMDDPWERGEWLLRQPEAAEFAYAVRPGWRVALDTDVNCEPDPDNVIVDVGSGVTITATGFWPDVLDRLTAILERLG